MKTVKTKKGTALPLTNLKGKDYLQVAYRIQWFTEEEPRFEINTEFHVLNDEQTVCQATIKTFSEDGRVVRQATATKRETKKDFSDHTEKAETGAIGRALIELGYGTQFALADLDEGSRIVDSPLVDAKTSSAASNSIASPQPALTATAETALPVGAVQAQVEPLKKGSFNRNRKAAAQQTSSVGAVQAAPTAQSNGAWE